VARCGQLCNRLMELQSSCAGMMARALAEFFTFQISWNRFSVPNAASLYRDTERFVAGNLSIIRSWTVFGQPFSR
jgi:hypothetical protein